MSEAEVQPETQAVSVQVLSYSLYSRHFHMIIVIVRTSSLRICHASKCCLLKDIKLVVLPNYLSCSAQIQVII